MPSKRTSSNSLSRSTVTASTPGSPTRASLTLFGQVIQVSSAPSLPPRIFISGTWRVTVCGPAGTAVLSAGFSSFFSVLVPTSFADGFSWGSPPPQPTSHRAEPPRAKAKQIRSNINPLSGHGFHQKIAAAQENIPGPVANHEHQGKPGHDCRQTAGGLLDVDDVKRPPQEEERGAEQEPEKPTCYRGQGGRGAPR